MQSSTRCVSLFNPKNQPSAASDGRSLSTEMHARDLVHVSVEMQEHLRRLMQLQIHGHQQARAAVDAPTPAANSSATSPPAVQQTKLLAEVFFLRAKNTCTTSMTFRDSGGLMIDTMAEKKLISIQPRTSPQSTFLYFLMPQILNYKCNI